MSQKPARELVLQAFVDQEYLRPALENVRAILRAGAYDMPPRDTKTAPGSVKRKAVTLSRSGAPKKTRGDQQEVIVELEGGAQPKRVCRNRQRSKRCLSVDERIEAQFDSHLQQNCNACLIGYQANGNWTKLRAEKHDASTQ